MFVSRILSRACTRVYSRVQEQELENALVEVAIFLLKYHQRDAPGLEELKNALHTMRHLSVYYRSVTDVEPLYVRQCRKDLRRRVLEYATDDQVKVFVALLDSKQIP